MARLFHIILSLVLTFPVVFNSGAQAVSSVSITGQIFAEVIPVFSAAEVSQLNFGRFAPGPQGGEIILTPQNTISVLGSVYAGTGVHSPAGFYISGDADASYSITVPVNPVILTHVSGSRTMLVDNWISSPSPGLGTGMLKNGYQMVYVGATLKVGTLEDNPPGIYSGTYNITFDFN